MVASTCSGSCTEIGRSSYISSVHHHAILQERGGIAQQVGSAG
jgi:hypothetical protein